MRAALYEAGMAPEDVDYINAHGTSTPLNDASEVKAIRDVFGEHARKLAINSTKSMIGHPMGAAGALERCQPERHSRRGRVRAVRLPG